MSSRQRRKKLYPALVFDELGEENVERVARAISGVRRTTANVWLRYLAYKTSIRLRKLGFGYKRTARMIQMRFGYGISSGTIVNWMSNRYSPLGRHKLLQMSQADAYVLAAAIGDGTSKFDIERGGLVRFQHLKDKDFAETIAIYSRSKVKMNKSHGYDAIVRNTILSDLVLAGKRDTFAIFPLLQLHPKAALKGFFDAEGGVDPTHGVPRAFNTKKKIIKAFSFLLDQLSIHHTVTMTRMKPLFRNRKSGKIYRRKALLKYGINVASCCMKRFHLIVSFVIKRKRKMLARMVQRRDEKRLHSCPIDMPSGRKSS